MKNKRTVLLSCILIILSILTITQLTGCENGQADTAEEDVTVKPFLVINDLYDSIDNCYYLNSKFDISHDYNTSIFKENNRFYSVYTENIHGISDIDGYSFEAKLRFNSFEDRKVQDTAIMITVDSIESSKAKSDLFQILQGFTNEHITNEFIELFNSDITSKEIETPEGILEISYFTDKTTIPRVVFSSNTEETEETEETEQVETVETEQVETLETGDTGQVETAEIQQPETTKTPSTEETQQSETTETPETPDSDADEIGEYTTEDVEQTTYIIGIKYKDYDLVKEISEYSATRISSALTHLGVNTDNVSILDPNVFSIYSEKFNLTDLFITDISIDKGLETIFNGKFDATISDKPVTMEIMSNSTGKFNIAVNGIMFNSRDSLNEYIETLAESYNQPETVNEQGEIVEPIEAEILNSDDSTITYKVGNIEISANIQNFNEYSGEITANCNIKHR